MGSNHEEHVTPVVFGLWGVEEICPCTQTVSHVPQRNGVCQSKTSVFVVTPVSCSNQLYPCCFAR